MSTILPKQNASTANLAAAKFVLMQLFPLVDSMIFEVNLKLNGEGKRLSRFSKIAHGKALDSWEIEMSSPLLKKSYRLKLNDTQLTLVAVAGDEALELTELEANLLKSLLYLNDSLLHVSVELLNATIQEVRYLSGQNTSCEMHSKNAQWTVDTLIMRYLENVTSDAFYIGRVRINSFTLEDDILIAKAQSCYGDIVIYIRSHEYSPDDYRANFTRNDDRHAHFLSDLTFDEFEEIYSYEIDSDIGEIIRLKKQMDELSFHISNVRTMDGILLDARHTLIEDICNQVRTICRVV